ncbi:MAG: 30S ribosomal protein S9 [Candidatus Pacebacteria bacterium]|nr:30S ribosomal protein S9 [Candidatus Paceibacterota bacterium]
MPTTAEKTKYTQSVGRRKTSSARARLTPASKFSITINDRELADYFKTSQLQKIVTDAFDAVEEQLPQKFTVTIHAIGGGISSQAQAVRHALARALATYDASLRTPLKKLGYLMRDPRAKERRKFGLKKARKAPQWSKR